MKKLLVTALAVGSLVLPLANAAASPVRTEYEKNETTTVVKGPDGVKQTEELVLPGTDEEYTLRRGDELEIKMQFMKVSGQGTTVSTTGDSDLNLGVPGKYLVRTDGHITLPMLGDISVMGKTVAQLTEEITAGLAEYIVNPQVTLNVTKLGYTRVYVFGEVNRQGLLKLEDSHTLIDAIGSAYGFTEKGAKRCVYVLRKRQADFVTKVDMMALFTRNNQRVNVELQDGDVVYISSNHKLTFAGLISLLSNAVSTASDIKYLDK